MKTTTSETLRVGDLEMDVDAHSVKRGKREIRLNRKEFALECLMRHQGIVLTRTMILETVWGLEADPFTNTVDVHIRFLRRKVDAGCDKKLIRTVHGFGYKMEQ